MSSAVLVPGVPSTSRRASAEVVRSIARIEVRRLLHQPVFLVAVFLFVLMAVTTPFSDYANADYVVTAENGTETNLDWPVVPAFFLGLGGLIAMNRVAKGASRTGDVLEAAPATKLQRSLALCLVCLVPAVVAFAGAAYVFVFWMVDPPLQAMAWTEFTDTQLFSIMVEGVLAAVGGPLLGVAVARWWRWPTAGAITAVALILWAVLSSVYRDSSWWGALIHHSSPFALAVFNTESSTWAQGGSHHWRVAYLAGLCLLAALAACAHGTTGEQRRQLVRVSLAVGGLTVIALLLATFTGPEGHYGPWNPLW
ncbi:hypothetical protein [Knoellia sp. Soil729]|uniref:hypothetical protein n=1 Tax=Knoellia sp. Soil729 TaxID=1736394 RepID=UPI0006F3B3C8|nr:hypothetical protein [Knoellia sp. Soil729]KRE42251.1 hypothetical protein ASG74_07310 [Knoellia sp. Soil729]